MSSDSEYWKHRADKSDIEAARRKIDPPRPGRKTHQERLNETREMTTDEIKATIGNRESEGKECGVLYRVLSER